MSYSKVLVVAGVYVLTVSVAFAVTAALWAGEQGAGVMVLGALVGSYVGDILYHRNQTEPAPFKVKATVGIVMAVLWVIQILIFQAVWHWTTYPGVIGGVIGGAIGTFVIPLVWFGTVRKAKKKDSDS